MYVSGPRFCTYLNLFIVCILRVLTHKNLCQISPQKSSKFLLFRPLHSEYLMCVRVRTTLIFPIQWNPSFIQQFWSIGRSRGVGDMPGARPPYWTQFFYFCNTFLLKSARIRGPRPPNGSTCPPNESTPPYGKSWIRNCGL